MIFSIVLFALIQMVSAKGVVVDVKNSIPLKNNQRVEREYFLNVGEIDGARPKQLYEVSRFIYLSSPPGVEDVGPQEIPVGLLQVTAVFPHFAIAKEFKLGQGPSAFLNHLFIMRGDGVRRVKSTATK